MVYLVHWIFTFYQTVELLALKDTALSDEGLGGQLDDKSVVLINDNCALIKALPVFSCHMRVQHMSVRPREQVLSKSQLCRHPNPKLSAFKL